jgi:hypothetical protein
VKLRAVTVIAFGIGYAVGSRAGRESYDRIIGSPQVVGTTSLVAEKTKAAASLGVERLRDSIGVRLGWRDGDQAADAIALDLAEDLATALNGRRR